MDPSARLEPVDPASLGSLQILSIKFLGRATASRSSGHSHSPFGTQGSDSYAYDDRLVTGNLDGRLKTHDFEPIVALQAGERMLLLARGYIPQKDDQFRWLERRANGTFEEIGVKGLPRDTWFLRFSDPFVTYYYRTWMLLNLGQNAGAPIALECFDSLIAADPACFRLKYSSGWDSPSSANYCEFLRTVVSPSMEPRFVPGLTKVLNLFEAGDIPVDISYTYSAILKLDPVGGCEIYWKFRNHVVSQKIADDKRAQSFPYDDDELKAIGCVEPNATSQPIDPQAGRG